MKLAISNIAWPPALFDDVLALMDKHGARGLEIAPGLLFPACADPFNPPASMVAQVREKLQGFGVQLVSMQSLLFGVEGAFLFGEPAHYQAFEDGISRAIDLGALLGIPNLVLGSPKNRMIPGEMSQDAATARAIECFTRLGDRAKAANTKLALEPNPRAYGTNFLNRVEDVHALCRQIDHPHVTLNFDLGCLHMNNEIDRAGALFRRCARDISHIHVSEPDLAPAPADPGQFQALASDILEAGYEQWFSIEMRPPEQNLLGAIDHALRVSAAALICASGDDEERP